MCEEMLGVVPCVIAMLPMVAALIAFPDIALFLPAALRSLNHTVRDTRLTGAGQKVDQCPGNRRARYCPLSSSSNMSGIWGW